LTAQRWPRGRSKHFGGQSPGLSPAQGLRSELPSP
jgi:hypothetical protein